MLVCRDWNINFNDVFIFYVLIGINLRNKWILMEKIVVLYSYLIVWFLKCIILNIGKKLKIKIKINRIKIFSRLN